MKIQGTGTYRAITEVEQENWELGKGPERQTKEANKRNLDLKGKKRDENHLTTNYTTTTRTPSNKCRTGDERKARAMQS